MTRKLLLSGDGTFSSVFLFNNIEAFLWLGGSDYYFSWEEVTKKGNSILILKKAEQAIGLTVALLAVYGIPAFIHMMIKLLFNRGHIKSFYA